MLWKTFSPNSNDEKIKDIPGFKSARTELVETALKYYQGFIEQRGDDPSVRTWVWYNLGVAFHAQDKLEDVIAAYRQQGQVKPDHEDGWNNLGLALAKQDKLEDAIAAYRQQGQVKPDHTWAWNNLGIVLYRQGETDEAITAFRKQIEVNPDHTSAWLMMGIALWKQGNDDAAASAYAKGLAIQPNDLSFLSNDAELALIQGDVTRFRARIAAALPQVTPKDQLFVILPLLAWLANPLQGWEDLMKATSELVSEVTISWDFSDTEHAIKRLDASTQQQARLFIDFFKGHIDLPALKARLATR
jgi:tetratricopeptide (TPR) repeat protein